MATPVTDRASFRAYCLRELGDGILNINTTEDHIDDRIDDAVQMFVENHMDGSEELYVKHVVTADDVTNGYITIPDNIIYMTGVFDLGASQFGTSLLDFRFQIDLQLVKELEQMGGMQSYVQTKQYVSMLNDLLNGEVGFRYNKHGKKLYLDIDWATDVTVGNYILIKAYAKVDEDVTEMWNDRWLKKYAVALLTVQWGRNLIKFGGVQTVGGVTFEGSSILQMGIEDRTRLEEELNTKYKTPIDFLIG